MNPPGFDIKRVETKKVSVKDRSWAIVKNAAKGIPMNAFMLWMSGASVQIFSILMTLMVLFGGVKGMYGMPANVEHFGSKLAWVAVHLAMIGLGVGKCWQMGLFVADDLEVVEAYRGLVWEESLLI